MKLYEIDEAIMACVDMESGEIIDDEKLASLEMEKERKLENIGKWMKNIKADIEAYKTEEDALKNHRKALERQLDDLGRWVGNYLQGQKTEAGTVRFWFPHQEPKVILLTKPGDLPREYRTASESWRSNDAEIRKAILGGADLEKYAKLDMRPKASVR